MRILTGPRSPPPPFRVINPEVAPRQIDWADAERACDDEWIVDPHRTANAEFFRLACRIALLFTLIIAFGAAFILHALARDNGRYTNAPLKSWFDSLASQNGLCCSVADGLSIADVDWDMQSGHYRVLLHGEWVVVPERAIVRVRNLAGSAVVWPDATGGVRCFLPGSAS